MNAVVVECAFHIVVGPKSETHFAPGIEHPLQMIRAEAVVLRFGTAVEDAFASLWISHKGMCLRRRGVGQVLSHISKRVAHSPVLRVVHLKMQMGSHTAAGISADGNKLSPANRNLVRTEIDIGRHLRRLPPLGKFVGLAVLLPIV